MLPDRYFFDFIFSALVFIPKIKFFNTVLILNANVFYITDNVAFIMQCFLNVTPQNNEKM